MNDVWDALTDPTRREILMMLKKNDMNAGEIAEKFDISKPSISHHLNILRNAGLVRSEKHGQNVIYTISTSVLEDVMNILAVLIEKRK
ncbi:autorepressor SdpR family transcription factor [Flexilinea flocculi]|jgi:DNA-binding transcriptional ArsR family regulator|uniref:DNA-binding transcriptional regulator, ArsR family n=1 Tax=Flexilinea flocculi TaxID=1678840 RepID=A0A0S7BS42_9CHLR|nr:autorepressor SdpR family transcription factor [Flexilinea flocculi]NMB94629.1 winged helix-turn-helix transcriptional regulator [Flexilinea flocculi]GAP41259.1 DNA-binding transcriptional regulator, ArsR family [Flexilinea flocculi]